MSALDPSDHHHLIFDSTPDTNERLALDAWRTSLSALRCPRSHTSFFVHQLKAEGVVVESAELFAVHWRI